MYIALVLLLAVYVHGQEEESYELPHAKLFAYKVSESVITFIYFSYQYFTRLLTYIVLCALILAF